MADNAKVSGWDNFLNSFTNLIQMPRALWFVIGAFAIESTAYFGILTLMVTYLTSLGWGDKYASMTVSVFTMLVTLFMLGVGSWAERFGLRRAIIWALAISVLGRAIYCLAPRFPAGLVVVLAVLGSLVLVAMGSGILQPTSYSGVKQYTNDKTASMGYALIYAFMNLGLVGIGELSARIRPAVQDILEKHEQSQYAGHKLMAFLAQYTSSGVQAVNLVCFAITLATLILFLLLMTRKAEAAKLRPDLTQVRQEKTPILQLIKGYFVDGPFGNARFVFFIFMLLPVRTLFAHQWLTMPEYILRAYSPDVANNMERLINWINPGIIFFGVPLTTALTRKINVYTMMIVGSLISALPTFLLCTGPNLSVLITYFVIFSIGEALWSARFLEYASELAPPGRVAQYMGLAQIPWLLAKGTTGFYSGIILETFCAKGVPPAEQHTGWMWLIYGGIAMASPIGLWLGRKWVRSGMIQKPI